MTSTAETTDGTAQVRTPILEVRGLSVDFAVEKVWVPAAKGLDYSIAPGEVLAIVGESGSGKSVSSMAVLDLLPENARISGSIKLRGSELRGLRGQALRDVRGNDIAVIFQEPMTALNPVYTVGSQIIETLRVHYGISPSSAKERALELLRLVELPDPQKAFDSYRTSCQAASGSAR
jgi:peptide/nickel transport system ATP-binding protein